MFKNLSKKPFSSHECRTRYGWYFEKQGFKWPVLVVESWKDKKGDKNEKLDVLLDLFFFMMTSFLLKDYCAHYAERTKIDGANSEFSGDRLSFLEAAVLDLATAVGRKVSILLRGEHKEQVQSATK